MLELGVNIDHVATLREARYRGRPFGEPDPVAIAQTCLRAGAHGITAHLREDRRHMQDADIRELRNAVDSRFNLELANTPEMIGIALQLKPDVVCLVPEKREEITTEGGLDVAAQEQALHDAIRSLNDHGIRVSLFIDPVPRQIEAAARTGTQFIELHTGAYAELGFAGHDPSDELRRLADAARLGHSLGLVINAGHGLNYDNTRPLEAVPHLHELNIGHAIVSRALVTGFEAAVRDMLEVMRHYPAH